LTISLFVAIIASGKNIFIGNVIMGIQEIDACYVMKLKALSETTRLKMIPHLSEPRTVKQIADILEVDHHALYHHMRVLEKAQIVELVKTRKVGNIVEKYFTLTDNWVVMLGSSEHFGVANLSPLIRQMVLTMLEDLTKATQTPDESASIYRLYFKFNSEDIKPKQQQLKKLIEDFIKEIEKIEDKDGDFIYSLNLLLFKMAEPPKEAK
jgi:DNA-binding transcriptional ArsR family regulator